MTVQGKEHAERYVKRSLESQKRLGYSGEVDAKVYEAAVKDAARAVDKLLRAQQQARVAA